MPRSSEYTPSIHHILSAQAKRRLQRLILSWFERNRRYFPWRQTTDPFAVLIAEKLLQQTAVGEVVIRAYLALLSQYPEPRKLANADIGLLTTIVKPLGLTYRAKELKDLGQALMHDYEGKVPGSLKELLSLPGVGDYAARAVLSFAYGIDTSIVDTNVARFLYRVYGIPGRLPANPARKKSLINLADTLIPTGKSKAFNLAILDLCALICKPKEPLCDKCPVLAFCQYGLTRPDSLLN